MTRKCVVCACAADQGVREAGLGGGAAVAEPADLRHLHHEGAALLFPRGYPAFPPFLAAGIPLGNPGSGFGKIQNVAFFSFFFFNEV